MYKMPRKPGYLGGYDWRASATGLLFLVGVSWIARSSLRDASITNPLWASR
jgi:hypothetical protein